MKRKKLYENLNIKKTNTIKQNGQNVYYIKLNKFSFSVVLLMASTINLSNFVFEQKKMSINLNPVIKFNLLLGRETMEYFSSDSLENYNGNTLESIMLINLLILEYILYHMNCY